MAKQKYWNGSSWVQVAPSMKEFNDHKTDYNSFKAQKGAANGLASLGADGKVLNRQLGYYDPSNNVLELINTGSIIQNHTNFQTIATLTPPHIGKYRVTGQIYMGVAPGTEIDFQVKITSGGVELGPLAVVRLFNTASVDFSIDMDTNFFPLLATDIKVEVRRLRANVGTQNTRNIALKGAQL